MEKSVSIFWFRRDLRFHDNAGLYRALTSDYPVQPIFIFDSNILDQLENKNDARVEFMHNELESLFYELKSNGVYLDARIGRPREVWLQLLKDYHIKEVFTNDDYEPYAIERDQEINTFLKSKSIRFISTKDHVVFEKDEILKDNGAPYTIYTPYSKKWKSKIKSNTFQEFPSHESDNWNRQPLGLIPALSQLGFEPTGISFPDRKVDDELIREYSKQRDYPHINGTSRLSVHLRFGTISIRSLVRQTKQLSEKFLNELIWRDFYHSILWHFPRVVNENFQSKYNQIVWNNNEDDFQCWCDGTTGYPIVDAGMRELNATGYMHNRVRMIVASFLTKHLLIDWRWGQAYFAEKLLDFELASNNGGWQWAAGTGVDAAPYFRIFNPYTQTEKFDPDQIYIKKWVPEVGTINYPDPIINHSFARERALKV